MQMIPPDVVVFCDPTLTALLQRLNAPSRHAIGAPVAVLSAPAALMLGQMARGARNDVLFPLAAAMDQEVRQKLVKPETRVNGWNNPLVLAVAAGRQARPAAEFDRRQFLRRGMSLGALTLLTGCDVSDSRAVQAMFGYVDRWNNLVQEALFSPTKLAPEYPEHMAVKDFRYNAWYEPALAPRLDPTTTSWS